MEMFNNMADIFQAEDFNPNLAGLNRDQVEGSFETPSVQEYDPSTLADVAYVKDGQIIQFLHTNREFANILLDPEVSVIDVSGLTKDNEGPIEIGMFYDETVGKFYQEVNPYNQAPKPCGCQQNIN